jgi:flagellar basal-body rod protein FlgB
MLKELLFDHTRIPLLGKALDAYSLRQQSIARNIANVETPGYQPERVTFEDEVARALSSKPTGGLSDPHHINIGGSPIDRIQASVQIDPAASTNVSGVNGVSIDAEMAAMAQNQIRFRFASKWVADTFKGIEKAIRGTV